MPKFADKHQCQAVWLGNRILRTDVAIASLLTLAHDVCDWGWIDKNKNAVLVATLILNVDYEYVSFE